MSCLEVMYQGSHYQPYQHYPFYQRHFAQKFGHYKMQDPPNNEPSYTAQSAHPPATSSSSPPSASSVHFHHLHGDPSPVPSASHPHQPSVKEESTSTGSDTETTVEAEYISSRCVLFTYYTGELNKVVDDHFSRALSQPSSFHSDGREAVRVADNVKQADWNSKNTSDSIIPPMCQRNLPASFWNSNYHHHHHHTKHVSHAHHAGTSSCQGSSTAHHHDSLFPDPYTSTLPRGPAVHQPDPWHYPYAVPQNSYTHRSGLHDLGYGMTSGGSAFNPRYSSLLIQPSVRPGRLPTIPGQCDFNKGSRIPTITGQCDFNKGGETWTGGYATHGPHSQPEVTSYGMESASTSALEAQDTSKDLYWF